MTKFALFGAGFIGKVHANNIAAHPRAELQYIYDINSEAAEQLASLYERARYAPPGEPLPEAALATARRDLCLLAGVPAA